jgi:hypothetical protein
MSRFMGQEPMTGSIDNPVTGFLDEMISRGASALLLRADSPAAFLVDTSIVKDMTAPDLDIDELLADIASLGINARIEHYGDYFHWSDDREDVYQMRFNVTFEARNNLPMVTFHYEKTLQKTEMDQGLLA